jgi:hypothetical protein
MIKRTKKQRKPNKAQQKRDQEITANLRRAIKSVGSHRSVELKSHLVPHIGQEVLILASEVNYAVGKVGVVQGPIEDGWAVKIIAQKVNAADYGTLEKEKSESIVFCTALKPYTPKDEKR